VFCLIFTRQIVLLFASGFDDSALSTTVTFTRITIFGAYGTLFVTYFRGYFHINNNFILPLIVLIPKNIFIILSIVISSFTHEKMLAYGFMAASLIQILIIIPVLFKYDFIYKLSLNLKDKHIKAFLLIVFPIMIGVAVQDINILVDRTIASRITVGGISALNYANSLIGFVQSVIVMAVTTAMFPLISKMASNKDFQSFGSLVKDSINLITIIVVPAIVSVILFSSEIVSLVFERGEFDDSAVSLTASVLLFYSFGMLGKGLIYLLQRVFFSLKDTFTPMIIAILTVFMNVTLTIFFYQFTNLGVPGVALATSIASFFAALALFLILLRKQVSIYYTKILIVLSKVLTASLLMGVITKLFHDTVLSIIGFQHSFTFIITIGFGVCLYFVLIYVFRIDEVTNFVQILRKKLMNNEREDVDKIFDDTTYGD